jgi:uncharacterized protein YjlB
MKGRRFNAMLGNLGASSALADMARVESGAGEPQILRLSRNGWVPNSEPLPVLLYRAVIAADGSDPGANFERAFARNGWPPQWRDGVYHYHHYYSTAHDVLGLARGRAFLILGGENGREVELRPGDVAVLPVGTGHWRIEASSDFLMVGAYPPDQHWDICRKGSLTRGVTACGESAVSKVRTGEWDGEATCAILASMMSHTQD